MKQINIGITCVGGRLIYDFIFALRQVKDFIPYIIGIDRDPSAHGRVLCDHFEVSPKIENNGSAYIERIFTLHKKIGIDVLIPLSEAESLLLSHHREELIQRGIHVSVSNASTVEMITDKYLMLDFLQKKHIKVGDYRKVGSVEELGTALHILGYPEKKVVVKPRKSAGSRGVMIVDALQTKFVPLLPERFCGTGNYEAVTMAMHENNLPVKDLIAVPYYEGQTFDVDCVVDNGRVSDCSARLRQLKNPLWPTSTGHKILLNRKVLNYAKKICAAFQVQGAADFDIILHNNEVPFLIDAGARFSGSVGENFVAGANFPAQLVRVLSGLPRKKYKLRNNCVLRPFITMAEIPSKNENDYL